MISLLMPVWNAAPFLREAIDSCLAQTHADFELVICDDGSTDGSAAILEGLRDPRVRLLRNDANRGISFTRNRLIGAARGHYLAWADADDVFHPERLAREAAYLDAHPECGVVSACLDKIVEGERVVQPRSARRSVNEHEVLALVLLFRSPLNDGLAMMRPAAIAGLSYPLEAKGGADYWMWWQMARRGCRFALLPDVLMQYRVHPGQISHREAEPIRALVREVKTGVLADFLGRQPTQAELEVHLDLVDPQRPLPRERPRIDRILEWVRQLGRRRPGRQEDILWSLAVDALGKKGVQVRATRSGG